MQNNTILKAIELGFNIENLDNEDTIQDLTKEVMDFLNDNLNQFETDHQECEVTSSGQSQRVSFGDYEAFGDIVDWSEYYFKDRQKIEHSKFVELLEDGTPVTTVLWCWSKDEETPEQYTYDIIFNDDNDSNNNGFKESLEYCQNYIITHNGSNHSYFEDYKGGTVQIVCNQTEEIVFETQVI